LLLRTLDCGLAARLDSEGENFGKLYSVWDIFSGVNKTDSGIRFYQKRVADMRA